MKKITKIADTINENNPIIESIQVVDPVKIIDITEKGINYAFWFSFVALIISSITLYINYKNYRNSIKKSEVYGKIIGKTFSKIQNFKELSGEGYIIQLSLSCIGKSLNFKDVNVYLYYGKEKRKGEIYWANKNEVNLGNSYLHDVKIPINEFLTFHNILQIDKTSFFYLCFILPNKKDGILYDKMELEFIKTDNEKLNIEIDEINSNQFYFDKSVFIPRN